MRGDLVQRMRRALMLEEVDRLQDEGGSESKAETTSDVSQEVTISAKHAWATLWKLYVESAVHGRYGVTGLLSELGADPNMPQSDGRLPLARACAAGRVQVVRGLIGATARPQSTTPHFRSDARADLTTQDSTGTTAFMHAVKEEKGGS